MVETRFEVLGPLRAIREGQDLDLGPAKQRAVLATLLTAANRPVATASIVDGVWRDDPPNNGANVVQKHIAGLRRALDPDRSPRTTGGHITSTDAGYVINVDPAAIDVNDFDRFVVQARTQREIGRLDDAAASLDQAFRLWRGDPYAGLAAAAVEAARDRYVDMYATAWELRCEIELDRGAYATAVPRLVDLVGQFPVREHLRFLLMLALYRCGRQAEALAAYREAQRYLADEFGVDPGAELANLHQRILRADPDLIPRVTEPAAEPGSGSFPPHPAVAPATGAPPIAPTAGPAAAVTWQPAEFPPPGGQPIGGHVTGGHVTGGTRKPALPRTLGMIGYGVGMLGSVVSLGFATWLLVGVLALVRRSLKLGFWAIGYAVLLGVCVVAIGISDSDTMLNIFVPILLLMAVGGAVQFGVLAFTSRRARFLDPAALATVEQQVRRDSARQIAVDFPDVAARLGIGRPDVARRFNDGGLIDINGVPAEVLVGVLGVVPAHAQWIVADRTRRGPFHTVDDLALRGLVSAEALHRIRAVLIAIPPRPDRSSAQRDAEPTAPM